MLRRCRLPLRRHSYHAEQEENSMSFDKPMAVSVAVLALVTAHALAQKNQESASPAKQEIVAQFDTLDADHNGALSKSEASKMPGMQETFERADANKDGKLDIAEFESVLRR
jgi:hypothetical protein